MLFVSVVMHPVPVLAFVLFPSLSVPVINRTGNQANATADRSTITAVHHGANQCAGGSTSYRFPWRFTSKCVAEWNKMGD
jgi:hypothetical protein